MQRKLAHQSGGIVGNGARFEPVELKTRWSLWPKPPGGKSGGLPRGIEPGVAFVGEQGGLAVRSSRRQTAQGQSGRFAPPAGRIHYDVGGNKAEIWKVKNRNGDGEKLKCWNS